MTKDKALKMALEALEKYEDEWLESGKRVYVDDEITAIKEALAQPEQEPVAWMNPYGGLVHNRITGHERNNFTIPLYTTPPQRKPLTDDEAIKIVQGVVSTSVRPIGAVALGLLVLRASEAVHGIT